jgi:tRNA (mo5U34)-methyltransferase
MAERRQIPPRHEIEAFVRDRNASGGSYHRTEVTDDLVIQGHYDMRRYLHHYGLPDDLSGQKALDIGTADGFFAREMERRGAEVSAIDVWEGDYYNRLCECLGSSVRYVTKSVYDLEPDFGSFDLVFCGSLLLHLSDPFRAVQAIRSVCRGQVILATTVMSDPSCEDRPYVEFLGDRGDDGDREYWTYWAPNVTALLRWLEAADFKQATLVSRFDLSTEEHPTRRSYQSPHAVVHGFV